MDEGVCAIRPGTDVGRYARLLARMHDALLSGDRPPVDPRRLVARSWLRVQAQGVDPDRRDPPGPLDASQVEQRRHPLAAAAGAPRAAGRADRRRRGRAAHHGRHRRRGPAAVAGGQRAVRRRADRLGFAEGADWTEGVVGTNAIGTALVRARCRCRCSPPSTSSAATTAGPAPPARSTTRATGAAGRRRRQRAGGDRAPDDRRARQHGGEARRGGPVAQPRAPARRAAFRRRAGSGVRLRSGSRRRRSRVGRGGAGHAARGPSCAAPTADGPVVVHGLGLCVPEPVPGGWLLRPGAGPAACCG